MIEILRLIVSILGMAAVSDGDRSVNMLAFDAVAQSPYFVGATLPGGVDTQIVASDEATLSARYMLAGVDYQGDSCRIFVENNAAAGEAATCPSVVTDSKALSFLNRSPLSGAISTDEQGRLVIRIGQKMSALPKELYEPMERCGRVEEFLYEVTSEGRSWQKRAQLYLPWGYDEAGQEGEKYDVLYLMHGGGDNSTSFFSDPRSPLPLTRVLDYLIAQGAMRPLLVVCPTFYDDDRNIGANKMEDAVAATRDFNRELREWLIPAVESRYRTHYDPAAADAVERSRRHRAFGGFSMGSLCTWYQLAYDVAAVGRFLPLSGDLWLYDAQGARVDAAASAAWLNERVQATPYARDFEVYAYTGSKDIACAPQQALVEALYALPDSLFTARNMQFGIKEGGVHYYGDINEYLYHALPLLFK